mmetsp:Transcript_6970/g.17244  ORF Transcript_6970/g.17244 Transcript_6970/m.17244 type:complete len:333 (-) Transcript_6970:2655-3653(-)
MVDLRNGSVGDHNVQERRDGRACHTKSRPNKSGADAGDIERDVHHGPDVAAGDARVLDPPGRVDAHGQPGVLRRRRDDGAVRRRHGVRYRTYRTAGGGRARRDVLVHVQSAVARGPTAVGPVPVEVGCGVYRRRLLFASGDRHQGAHDDFDGYGQFVRRTDLGGAHGQRSADSRGGTHGPDNLRSHGHPPVDSLGGHLLQGIRTGFLPRRRYHVDDIGRRTLVSHGREGRERINAFHPQPRPRQSRADPETVQRDIHDGSIVAFGDAAPLDTSGGGDAVRRFSVLRRRRPRRPDHDGRRVHGCGNPAVGGRSARRDVLVPVQSLRGSDLPPP